MALNAEILSPATIATATAVVGATILAVRALRAWMVPVVMVVDRSGKVHELPADDPRIASRL